MATPDTNHYQAGEAYLDYWGELFDNKDYPGMFEFACREASEGKNPMPWCMEIHRAGVKIHPQIIALRVKGSISQRGQQARTWYKEWLEASDPRDRWENECQLHGKIYGNRENLEMFGCPLCHIAEEAMLPDPYAHGTNEGYPPKDKFYCGVCGRVFVENLGDICSNSCAADLV